MKPTRTTKILRAKFASGRIVTATLTENSRYEGQVEVDIRPDDTKAYNGYAMGSSWDNDASYALTATLDLLTQIAKDKQNPIVMLRVFKSFKLPKD
jgi:hypothetical protein